MMILVLIILIAAAVILFRRFPGSRDNGSEAVLRILQERFARGEISREEYEERKAVLE